MSTSATARAATARRREGLRTKNTPAWLASKARLDRARPGETVGGPNGEDEALRLYPG